MAKTKLLLELECDFLLIGIIASVPDYKLVWSLNRSLSVNFERTNDTVLPLNSQKKTSELTLAFNDDLEIPYFPKFEYVDEEAHLSFKLVGNRSGGTLLIREEQSVDFFLIIDGVYEDLNIEKILEKLKADKMVTTAYEIDPNRLKSKQNLIFD